MIPSEQKHKMGIKHSLLLVTLIALAPNLDAQVIYGSITGNVTDKSGLPVPSAKIEALNKATGVAKQTASDARGYYLFNDLHAGVYKVTISAAGLASAVQNNIQLEANTQTRVNAALEPAMLNQGITVEATAAALLQADRVEANTQISRHDIEDLPMDGARNFQSLLDVVPGVTPPVASHSEAGNPTGAIATNVNGASYNNNGTRIEGVVNSYQWVPEIIAYVPPAEAIQAVSVSTSNFGAEQGMAGGSAVNVTMKSGTYAYHGAAWEYNTVQFAPIAGRETLPRRIVAAYVLHVGPSHRFRRQQRFRTLLELDAHVGPQQSARRL